MKNVCYAVLLCCSSAALSQGLQAPIRPDGTVAIPAFSLPYSNYASPESRQRLIDPLAIPSACRAVLAQFPPRCS